MDASLDRLPDGCPGARDEPAALTRLSLRPRLQPLPQSSGATCRSPNVNTT
ncbi:uncharacterized protein V6R79_019299 [Siganus canaliculatus]